MFGSAARWAREQVVAVVLSGLLDDGAVGAALVARSGGRVVIQDPAEAGFDSMPRAALAGAPSAAVVPSGQLGRTVAAMVDRGEPEGAPTESRWVRRCRWRTAAIHCFWLTTRPG